MDAISAAHLDGLGLPREERWPNFVFKPPQWNPPAYCQQWDTRTSDPGPHGHIAMSVQCGHLATGTRDGEPACDRHRTPGTTEKDIAP